MLNQGSSGFILIVVLFILVLGSATYLFTQRVSSHYSPEGISRSYQALKQAREHLLAYATQAQTSSHPGRIRIGELPCPDINRDGRISVVQDYRGPRCRTRLGWLPWASLEISELVDGSGEALWYAVAEPFFNYAGAAAEPVLNASTPSNLQLDGVPVVALVVAPGRALPGQFFRHLDHAVNSRRDYLEGINADDDIDRYSHRSQGNDLVMAITLEEWRRLISQQLVSLLAQLLNDFYRQQGFYPLPARNPGGSCSDVEIDAGAQAMPAMCEGQHLLIESAEHGWIIRNQWLNRIVYSRETPEVARLVFEGPGEMAQVAHLVLGGVESVQ